jgi:tetratricopeptide (TPR) repeat protein
MTWRWLSGVAIVLMSLSAWRLNAWMELKETRALLEAGQFEAALARSDRLSRQWPPSPIPESDAGLALYGLGRFAQASDRFVAHLEDRPVRDQAWAHYNRGNALVRLKRLSEAVEAYKQVLRLDPTDADARFNLVLVETWLNAQESSSSSSNDAQSPGQLTPLQARGLLDGLGPLRRPRPTQERSDLPSRRTADRE